MQGYTVIDLETTGFSPLKGDRIVEIGVVYVSPTGEIQNGWTTLVNPHRDVGATRIHGITASDVTAAPGFGDIAPYVLQSISGRMVAAHNAQFDLRFLTYELQQAGVPITQLPLPHVCTMTWSSSFVRSPTRRLHDVCHACGIDIHHAHSAYGDAMATAQLLSHYLRAAGHRPPWRDALTAADAYAWPTFTGTYPAWRGIHREQARAQRETTGAMPTKAARITLSPGDRVVFTGQMRRHREEWEAVAHEHGFTTGGVTRTTRVVVAADVNSRSVKATMARDYGIPIVTEEAFERLLGKPAKHSSWLS